MARTRTIGVLLVVATLLLWGSAAAATTSLSMGGGTVDASSTAQLQQEGDNASVTFEDQTVENGTVTVANVTVPEGGYVAIHNDSLRDGDAVGSVVGVSEYLDPGTHENVTVTLYENVSGADFENATEPTGTETLIAMPHEETSDETADNETTTTTEDGVGENQTTTDDGLNNTTTADGQNDTTTGDDLNDTTTEDGQNDTTTADGANDTTTDDGLNETETDEGGGANETETDEGGGANETETTTDGGLNETTTAEAGANDEASANAQQQNQTNQSYDFVATDGQEDGPYIEDGAAVTDTAEVDFSAPATDDGDEGAGAPENETDTNETQTNDTQAGSSFVVESIEAPALAAPNATITVNATVSNSADEERTEDVAFRLAGDDADVVVHQDVSVDADGNQTVTFDLNASDVGEGEYIHGVTTENSSAFATIEVTNDSQVVLGDQAGDGENVTVESVYVPEGGYVAVHNDSLLDGDAVGSVVGVSDYLEPGVHENVSVTLYEGVEGAEFATDASTEDNATLVAMPHLETTDDETYDFVQSEGEDDGPYTVDGEAVVDVGNLTVTAEDAPSGGDDDSADN